MCRLTSFQPHVALNFTDKVIEGIARCNKVTRLAEPVLYRTLAFRCPPLWPLHLYIHCRVTSRRMRYAQVRHTGQNAFSFHYCRFKSVAETAIRHGIKNGIRVLQPEPPHTRLLNPAFLKSHWPMTLCFSSCACFLRC